jgi:hypothetical protein
MIPPASYQQPQMPLPTPAIPDTDLPADWASTYSPFATVDAIVKDGRITCKFAKTTLMQAITTYQEVDGKLRPVTAIVGRSVQEERIYELKAIEVLSTDWKTVNEKEVAARLAKETPAVFVIKGQRYDPRLMELLKPETLIICAPSTAPASQVPPPTAPIIQ